MFEVRITRDFATRIDWDRKLLVIRKPRVLKNDSKIVRYTHVQAKRDGIRVIIARYTRLHVLTTQGHDLALQYDFRPTLWYRQLLVNTCVGDWFDCELHVPGKGAEAVKSAIANDIESVQIAGIGCSKFGPEEPLPRVSAWLDEHFIPPLPYAEVGDVDTAHRNWPHCDGVVYKTSHYGLWAKKKMRKTIDVIVKSIKPGSGKYWGQCGSLEVMLADGRVLANVSGMDDYVRQQISNDDIGRVCEIAYERVSSRGRLRHPRFERWRDDKCPNDCTIEQDPEL